MEPLETTIELDVPEEGEIGYEELFWEALGETPLPSSFSFLPEHIQNQGAKDETRMACSRFGITHAINAQNKAVSEIDWKRYYEFPASLFWRQYISEVPSAKKDWATLQSALKQMISLKLITGYTKVNGEIDMKKALLSYKPIYTGSKQCNWKTVIENKIYTIWTGYAHIFCIVWWDEKGWIGINSYGENNGVFTIPFSLTYSLFSCYAISDSRDEEVFSSLSK